MSEFQHPTATFGTALYVRQMAQAHAEYHDKVKLSEGTLNAIENSVADSINATVASCQRKQRETEQSQYIPDALSKVI